MKCPHCQHQHSRKRGRTAKGKQVYQCKQCLKTWVRNPDRTHPTLEPTAMLALYEAGATLAAIGVQAGVSRERVRQLLEELPEFSPRNVGRRSNKHTTI